MFTIGEFSKITGLSVKTLRYYHEEGLLAPRSVDPASGYRYYDEAQIETARAIACLRGLDFPLANVREILERQSTGESFVETLERHRQELEARLKQARAAMRTIDKFIADERAAVSLSAADVQVEEKVLEPALIAGVRMTGRYSDCGQGFAQIGRALGRYIAGKPFLLHYDGEFKADDAQFEACMPLRQRRDVEGISVRELAGGPAIALLHRGPYDEMGRSYARVLKYARQHGHEIALPTREVYIQGPGMIFRGNPRSYLTEIQLPIAAVESR